MTSTKVKICGVTSPSCARVAADCGAWAVGLVFHPGSPRFLTSEQALSVVKALPGSVLKVGVFMDASLEAIRRVEGKVPLDLVQLHGRGAAAAAKAFGLDRVIMAVCLRGEEDVKLAEKQSAAYLLMDRRRSNNGSSGVVDWTLAQAIAQIRAGAFLAGGLTPKNVLDAIRTVRPSGVDVSSGVESAPGVKDQAKIREFFKEVRKADALA